MSEKVLLEEGVSVSIHTRIKDMCKQARNRLGITNQEICNRISEKFNIEDFSVNTVNNFFSERSKATTIYTTGYICAVLNISIDAIFGIEKHISTNEEIEFVRQLQNIKAEYRLKEQENEHLKQIISEKDERIAQAHNAVEHYRLDSNKKVPSWIFIIVLVLLICTIVCIIVYLIIFDIKNPDYGIFISGKQK